MTDKEINTNKYFVELTDIGGGTIGYTVPFPEELLRDIIKQNKQLARKTQECEELKRKVELMMDCPDCKVDEYKKALDEIEKAFERDIEYGSGLHKQILDIISKAKE